MNEENNINKRRSQIFTGLFILVVGAVLLLKESGVYFPYWFLTWPVLMIVVGVFIGLRHNFRNNIWMILVFIGGVFLVDHLNPGLNLQRYIWPVVIIAWGLFMIFRPKNMNRRWRTSDETSDDETQELQPYATDHNDHIDATAVFGAIKKNILSKNFRGGDITNFMGGSEINLTQSDINGRITIDVTTIFGGTKLIVPPTWDVQSGIVAIFGGIEDKRKLNGTPLDANKVLYLDGTCIFGGIEIRSY